MAKKEYKKQKIDTYVSLEDVARLKAICEKSSFNSIYQLLQYLVYCFLRVADSQNDPIDEPIPDEIYSMFSINSEWEKETHSRSAHAGMRIKKKTDQRKIKHPEEI